MIAPPLTITVMPVEREAKQIIAADHSTSVLASLPCAKYSHSFN
ncbi:MAG: hypothetical protein ACR5LB_10690 [Wolbachia sp.]